MKYFITRNQDKANTFIDILNARGHTLSTMEEADFVLFDHNWSDAYRNGLYAFRYCKEHGKRIFMFPHGFRSYLFWDAVYETDDAMDAFFVPSTGQKEVLQAGGWQSPIVVTGFPWAYVKPWEPSLVKKILFAPIHPDWDGSYQYSEYAKKWNIEIWNKLMPLKYEYNITAYYSFTPEKNGLTLEGGVSYLRSDLTTERAVSMIDEADLVIANDTFAALSLARGKPTIMFDDSYHHAPQKESKYWPYYQRHIYPFNIIGNENVQRLFVDASIGNSAMSQWIMNFIGGNFNANTFIRIIEDNV